MDDRKIKGMMVIAVLCIAGLLLPLQVFGETEEAFSAQEESAERTLSVNYEVEAESNNGPDLVTSYVMEEMENYLDTDDQMQFSLPPGAQSAVLRVSNLTVTRQREGEGTERRNCVLRLSISRVDPEDSTECFVTVTKEPLPVIRVSNRTAVHVEHGWYDTAQDPTVPLWPVILQDFVPAVQEESVAQEAGAWQGEDTGGQEETAGSQEDHAREQKEETGELREEADIQKEKTGADEKLQEAPAGNAVMHVDPAPVIERPKSNPVLKNEEGAGSVKQVKKSQKTEGEVETPAEATNTEPEQEIEKITRTLKTTISKPMNHVRITEQVTSGKTKIDQDSIRVRYNGKDVTDNCIIKMHKNGFTVDTQMNTNTGDSFVTTYDAKPEAGGPVETISTTQAEDPGPEIPPDPAYEEDAAVDAEIEPAEKTGAPAGTKHARRVVLVVIALLACGVLYLVRFSRHSNVKEKALRAVTFLKKYRAWLTEG